MLTENDEDIYNEWRHMEETYQRRKNTKLRAGLRQIANCRIKSLKLQKNT